MVNSHRGARPSRPPAARRVYSLSEEETFELGRQAGREAAPGTLILLVGELGLGKTVFAKGIAAGLGIPPEDVTSPTFTLVQEYHGGRLPLFHVDLYRVEDAAGLESLGLEEILESGGVVVVEWGEKLPTPLRSGALVVRFRDLGECSREILLELPASPAPAGGK